MSIKVIQWVWDCSQSKNAERLVLLAIADNAADDGSHAYPSIAEVARKANLSVRGVQAAIARLVESGELKVNVGGGRGHTNYYTVIMKPCARNTPQNPHPSNPKASGETPQNPTGNPADSAGNPAESAPGTVRNPKNEPSSYFADESAPTAQTILAAFIDWLALPMQGSVKLSKRVIGMYAKAIKELLDEGFDGVLIRRALAAMYDRGLTDRPTLLHGLVVQVQAARPTSGGAKPFVQQADEYKQAKSEREDVVLSVMQELIDFAEREHGQQLSATKARKIVNGWIDSGQIELNGLSVSVPSLYSGYVEIAGEAEEVS